MEIKCPRCLGTREQVIGFEGKPVSGIFSEHGDVTDCHFCEGRGVVDYVDTSLLRGLEDAKEGRVSRIDWDEL